MLKREIRKILFDNSLQLEACLFEGISQPFPPHFHEYYVIGFIESGRRRLSVCGKDLTAEAGDILLFNPLDKHSCCDLDENPLTYRAFSVKQEVMQKLASELTGKQYPLRFSENLIRNEDLFLSLKKLHETVMAHDGCKAYDTGLEKEELFLLTFSQLIGEYFDRSESGPLQIDIPECREEIEKACLYMSENFSEHISLGRLCRLTALSRASLVRAFAKEKGIAEKLLQTEESSLRYFGIGLCGDAKKVTRLTGNLPLLKEKNIPSVFPY